MVSCAGCNSPVEYGGKGRPPKYCANCARKARKAKDSARYGKKYPRCCLEAQAAAVKTADSGTRVVKANVFVCEQHAQWAAFRRREVIENTPSEPRMGDGYRITANEPDNWDAGESQWRDENGIKHGQDARLERMADEWLLRDASHSAEPRFTKAQVTKVA